MISSRMSFSHVLKFLWCRPDIARQQNCCLAFAFSLTKYVGNTIIILMKLGDEIMLVNKICPNCGTEQVGLNLKETNGSFICSKCKRHFVVIDDIVKEINDSKRNSDK